MAAVPVSGWTTLWLTAPDAAPVSRQHPGPRACSTDQVLLDGLALHAEHAEDDTSSDRVAAAVLLEAARCQTMEQLPTETFIGIATLASHGAAWIAEREPAEVALGQLLDLWELAADQRRVGSYVNLAVWTSMQSELYEQLDALLADPATSLTDADRQAARARLLSLANQDLDTAEANVREEHDLWGYLPRYAVTPTLWWGVVHTPRIVLQTREGTSRFLAERLDEVRTNRLEAAMLAASLDLWDGCVDRLPTFESLEADDLDFERVESRCVVIGRSGDEIRVATTR